MAMEIGWAELGRYLGGAFALYLVLEGILPFLNPGAQRSGSWRSWRRPNRSSCAGAV